MIFAALNEAADRGELLLVQGGLCRWHRRRDGVVVIREILVLPSERGDGIGSDLVAEVRLLNPGATVRASCPASYPSNAFWNGLGFVLKEERNGINVWELQP